jgi:hypothetical protein
MNNFDLITERITTLYEAAITCVDESQTAVARQRNANALDIMRECEQPPSRTP